MLGTVLKAKSRKTEFSDRVSADGVNVELFVENLRPATEVSRLKSIFMVEKRSMLNYLGAAEDYVYLVKATGHVTKANFAWFSELLSLARNGKLLRNTRAVKCAVNYWKATPVIGQGLPSYRKDGFEYLASSVIFEKMVK